MFDIQVPNGVPFFGMERFVENCVESFSFLVLYVEIITPAVFANDRFSELSEIFQKFRRSLIDQKYLKCLITFPKPWVCKGYRYNQAINRRNFPKRSECKESLGNRNPL